ncbi:MAG: hypothetical protein QW343_02575 [Candidatus Norongarragalinales archaeon]
MKFLKILGWTMIIAGVFFVIQGLNFWFEGNPLFLGLKLLKGVKDSLEPFIIGFALIIIGWIVRRE